jgi:hypothetical protein
MTHITQSVSELLSRIKCENSKHDKVEFVFMKTVWQEWAIHLPPVFVKNLCSRLCHNHWRRYDLKWGLRVKICHLVQNL